MAQIRILEAKAISGLSLSLPPSLGRERFFLGYPVFSLLIENELKV